MKTISGSILASKPIALSKAASTMNNFLSSETGASTAISSYLRRSAAAFNELVQTHKELKGARSERKHKHKKSCLETFEENHEENNLAIEVKGTDSGEEQNAWYPENSGLGSADEEGRTKERKKKKKRKQSDQIDEVQRESGGRVEIEVEEIKEKEKEKEKEKKKKKKKKKKKRDKPEIEDEGLDDSEERHRMKKKKRKHEIKT